MTQVNPILAKFLRILEIVATLAFLSLEVLTLIKLAQDFSTPAQLLGGPLTLAILFALLIAGYLTADFISGFVHFLGDNFGDEKTPFFGPAYILPFRIHHVNPTDITKHGFFATNGNNSLVSLPPLILFYLVLPTENIFAYFFLAYIFAVLMGIFATNQFHKWAHFEKVKSPIIRALQKARLILSRDHHQIHHTSPYDRYYCITVGWLNRPLEKLRFFEKILKLAKKS